MFLITDRDIEMSLKIKSYDLILCKMKNIIGNIQANAFQNK